MAGTLAQVVRLAELTVENCDGAAVLGQDATGALAPIATSNDLAVSIEAVEAGAGEGPGHDASTRGQSSYTAELATESRWPAFTRGVEPLEVRSVLAWPLSADRSSSLSLYSRLPTAFDATARAEAHLFATLAHLALDSAEDRALEDARTENLHEALRTRELIGQAQGILMERERITADEAFAILRRASQQMNVKLRAVAETLVETGETPPTPPEPGTAP